MIKSPEGNFEEKKKKIEEESDEDIYELTDSEKEALVNLGDGLSQMENEAGGLRDIPVSAEKDGKMELKKKLKKAGVKAVLFLTLMASMGAFPSEAQGNNLGKLAGNAVERMFNGGYTLRESEKIRGAVVDGYVREIRSHQHGRERSLRSEQRRFDRTDDLTQKVREVNYKMEVDRIMNDKTLDAQKRAAALRGAESLLD
jgi:hypothetical protein